MELGWNVSTLFSSLAAVGSPPCSFWLSDEYGPYIYRFSSSGHLIQTIQPPPAILPHGATGALNFTSVNDPATGRAGNQGRSCQFVREVS